LVFPLSLLAVYKLEHALARASNAEPDARVVAFVPIATLLLAVQDSFLSAGSTGLETGFAALLVTLGTLFFVRARRARDFAYSGGLLILASLTRPDHAIYYAVGAGCLVLEEALGLRGLGSAAKNKLKPALARTLAYAAPFALYAAHTAWRYTYYGELLPNTFYAKSASSSYLEQGVAYAATFYLGSHLAWLLPVLFAYWAWPSRSLAERRFKRFTALAFVLFNLYVLQVGGDFMYGRFFVTLLPLVLVSLARATLLVLDATRARPARAYALAALVAASAGGISMIAPRQVRWGICDERTMYPVERLHPLQIGTRTFESRKCCGNGATRGCTCASLPRRSAWSATTRAWS
jgi:hypothetical protein